MLFNYIGDDYLRPFTQGADHYLQLIVALRRRKHIKCGMGRKRTCHCPTILRQIGLVLVVQRRHRTRGIVFRRVLIRTRGIIDGIASADRRIAVKNKILWELRDELSLRSEYRRRTGVRLLRNGRLPCRPYNPYDHYDHDDYYADPRPRLFWIFHTFNNNRWEVDVGCG